MFNVKDPITVWVADLTDRGADETGETRLRIGPGDSVVISDDKGPIFTVSCKPVYMVSERWCLAPYIFLIALITGLVLAVGQVYR
jgi:hypothetical protein